MYILPYMAKYVPICKEYVHILPYMAKYVPICKEYVHILPYIWPSMYQFAKNMYLYSEYVPF